MEDSSMTSSKIDAFLTADGGGEGSIKSNEATVAKLSLDNISILSPSEFSRDMNSLEQIQQTVQHNHQKEDASTARWSSSVDTTMGEVLAELEEMSVSTSKAAPSDRNDGKMVSESKDSSSLESANLVQLLTASVGTMSISEGALLESIKERTEFSSGENKKSSGKSFTMDESSLPFSQGSSDVVRELGGGKSVAVDSMLSDPTMFATEMDEFEPLSDAVPHGSEMGIDPTVANQIVNIQLGATESKQGMKIAAVLKMMEDERMTTIHHLEFTNTLLNDGDVKPIVLVLEQASKTNTTLDTIYHGGSFLIKIDRAKYSTYDIGDDGATTLANALKSNPPLRHLSLSHNSIGVEGATELARALETNTMLQELGLWHNSIGDEGAKELAKALQKNSTLQSIDIGSNAIDNKGAEAWANTLETNTALQELGLWHNSIGDEGAKELAKALQTNTTLQSINLGSNSIGDKGATELAKGWGTNTALLILILDRNWIGDDGAKALANALGTSTSLQELHLTDNSIGIEGATELANALETNTTLQELGLRLNAIGVEGATELANALETNTTLQELGLRLNAIGVEGANALLKGLQNHNGTLSCINVSDNNITRSLKEEIESLVEQNSNGTRFPRPTPRLPDPSRSFSIQERTYIDETEITEIDVVGGPRSTGSSHPGNNLYRNDVEANKPIHHSLGSKHGEKKKIRNSIINNVVERGGRFITEKNGLFYLLSRKEAEDKVAQALKPRKSRAKTEA